MINRTVRLHPLPPSEWTEEVRDCFVVQIGPEAREKGTTANMPLTFARHPQLSRALVEFSRKVQSAAEISPRLREIVIMRVAWHYQSDYEWGQHHRIMRSLGLGDEYVRAIKIGPEAQIWTDVERAAVQAVDDLTHTREIKDETWTALTLHLSPRQILDVLLVTGQYTMVAMTCNAIGLKLDTEFNEYAFESVLSAQGDLAAENRTPA